MSPTAIPIEKLVIVPFDDMPASVVRFEDAIRQGLQGAAKTVRNIKGAWVKEQQVVVDNDQITQFRVDLKVTFVLD